MGTNYYWRPLVTEEEREKILEKVKNSKTIQEIKDFIYYDLSNGEKSEIHIGKSSHGWQFLFNLGIRNYTHGQSLKKEDIDKWFRSGVIFDEYGDEISADDFFEWLMAEHFHIYLLPIYTHSPAQNLNESKEVKYHNQSD